MVDLTHQLIIIVCIVLYSNKKVMNVKKIGLIWVLTIPLFIGIVIASYSGFFTPGFYSLETLSWQVQSKGQDLVDLFVAAPILLITAWLAFKGSKMAFLAWGGVNLFLVYTFIIYCFDVQFNSLFLIYCSCLGLAVYSLLFFLYKLIAGPDEAGIQRIKLFRITSIYFLVLAILFYGLWLSNILPALMNGSIPKEITELGLPTNPVHVIDLSVLLPALFIIGILLWKNNSIGVQLAPVILVFFILMNITIALLNYLMGEFLLTTNTSITWMMSGLALFSMVLGYQYLAVFKQLRLSSSKSQLSRYD